MRAEKKELKLKKELHMPGYGYKMPIVGNYGPVHERTKDGYTSPDFVTDRTFRMLEDAGVNLINCTDSDYKENSQEYKDIMYHAGYHKIGVFVKDSRIKADMTAEKLQECMDDYSGERAFAGICLTNADSELSAQLNSYDNMIGYCDVDPLAVDGCVSEYEKYLREYIETAKPKVIGYKNFLYSDVYDKKCSEAKAYKCFLQNAAVVAKLSKEYNIPFWGFIQAGGNFDTAFKEEVESYYPADAEFLWQVNVYLAYGARGMQYYPVIQDYVGSMRADKTIDYDKNGIIGADTLPTIYWSYMKQANEYIREYGPMLMQCRHEGIIATGKAKELFKDIDGVIDGDTYRQLKSVETGSEDGAVIGCLDFKHRTAFYVVNNNLDRRQEVTLNFDGEQKSVVVLKLGNRRTESKTDKVTLSLKAGGAALVFLWKHLGD